jgi:CRISPR-associated protein Csd1
VIIPALVDYYKRLEADSNSGVAPFGWSRQQVSFAVMLTAKGGFKGVHDYRLEETIGKKTYRKPRSLVVPGQAKPPGTGINPGLLWDNPAYMLGLIVGEKETGKKADTKRTRQSFEAFRERHLACEKEIADEQFTAVCRFLRAWEPDEHKDIAAKISEYVPGFGVFQIMGEADPVHERPAMREYWTRCVEQPDADEPQLEGVSLVSGQREVIARVHEPKIKRVSGAQSSGAALISFNCDAFESYGKDQSYNAPVGRRDTFAYCTALNALLEQKSRRVVIGDDTYVVWAGKPVAFEDDFLSLLGVAHEAEDQGRVEGVRKVLDQIASGTSPASFAAQLGDASTPFFVLGLSPNAARLHVRFWERATLGELATRLAHHHAALDLEGAPEGYTPPTVRDIVGETLPAKDGRPDHERADKSLASEIVRAVITGRPYPRRLLSGVVERVRVDGFSNRDRRFDARRAAHRRASIIRACLINDRSDPLSRAEVPMSLDESHPSAAYQIGRMFAVIEKTQEEAMDGINRTVKDAFFASASSTPAVVYPRLLTLHAHHLRKIELVGRRKNLERMMAQINEQITAGYPKFLNMEQRGLFFLGYYHQRAALFTKKSQEEAEGVAVTA